MAAASRSSNGIAADLDQLAGRITELERREAISARVFANVAARLAPSHWTEFRTLLVHQYNVTHTDAEAFMEILTGRKP